jgi:hypothetical protein
MPTQNPDQLPESADIVIVGAGVAGLYCAWRLLDWNPAQKIVIVERLNRTGGRLDTDLIKVQAPDDDDVTVRDEEGGMRFNYGMKELMTLSGALDLCDDIVPFPMEGENNRYFMRGVGFTLTESQADHNHIWSQLYNLTPDEQNQSPVEIVTKVYHEILAANDKNAPDDPTPEFWQWFRLECKWKDVPLNEWQLWGLFRDLGYSEECITMLTHALGFEGPFLSLANAGEAFQILEDFPKNPTYFTFRRGYSTLPNALVEKIESAGGQIFLGINVDAITAGEDGYNLQLTIAPPDESASRYVPGGVTGQITAPKVILAVASKALENLFQSSPVLHDQPQAEQLWNDIQSVVNMRLLKINLYYEEAWWENDMIVNPPIKYGPSFTDLPINSVYPFYPISGPEEDNPAALTIYCDFNNTNFWQGLQNVPPYFESALQEQHSQPPQVLFPASVAVVEEATKQFRLLYNTNTIPEPVLTSYRLWGGESDFGYAYHQWALNADDRRVMAHLAEPIVNLYTCNEAYSDMQGWVNGSLRSADLALNRIDSGTVPLVKDPKFKDEACQNSAM